MSRKRRWTAADWARLERLLPLLDGEGIRSLRDMLQRLGGAASVSMGVARRGRPTRSDVLPEDLERALALHGSVRAAARAMGVPKSTLARHAARVGPVVRGYGLEPRHAKLLCDSGISAKVARARGYESVQGGLLIPIWDAWGEKAWHQTRLDVAADPRKRFVNSSEAGPIVDVPPFARARVLSRHATLYITESPRKADAAASRALACVDFPGVRMVERTGRTWDRIGVRGRDVRIVFDADAGYKGDVRFVESLLASYLRRKGARVTVLRLPADGLDDYLSSGGDLAAVPVAPARNSSPGSGRYTGRSPWPSWWSRRTAKAGQATTGGR